MSKKIAQYLPALFALIALVMLLGIAAERGDAPAGTEPPATTAPAGQIAEETEPEAPAETQPRDAMPRVEAALDRYSLKETATASSIRDDGLHADGGTTGAGKAACAHALADLCDERRMNPIAAFWMLTRESLFEYRRAEEAVDAAAFTLPIQSRKQYPYTAEGAQELLTDILKLSKEVGDGMGMDDTALGMNDRVDSFQVFHHKEERCYYAYFVLYGERSAHFLCFYIRGDELIDDLEFQLLNLRYAEGDAEALERIDRLGDRQAATIMAAAEQLLTGSSRADEGSIPLGYTCDSGRVTIERFAVTGDGEQGTLTNYDLHIAQ